MSNQTLSDGLHEQLLRRIVDKEWNIGDQLPSENQLCKEYGMSRISVRSAIQKLQAQNLIITRPGKGSFVIANSFDESRTTLEDTQLHFSQNEFHYFVEFRRAIEFYSVELMCKRGNDEDLKNVYSGLDLMKNNPQGSEKFNKGDILFHTSIIKGSHNPMFISILNGCRDEYDKYMGEANSKILTSHEHVIDNHTMVYEAIADRDAKKARNILESIVEYNSRIYKSHFRQA